MWPSSPSLWSKPWNSSLYAVSSLTVVPCSSSRLMLKVIARNMSRMSSTRPQSRFDSSVRNPATSCQYSPVKPDSITLRTPQLVVRVPVNVVGVLGQYAREDAVEHREHLPVGDPHGFRRRLVAVLDFPLVHGDDRRHDQIADILAERDTPQRRPSP